MREKFIRLSGVLMKMNYQIKLFSAVDKIQNGFTAKKEMENIFFAVEV